MRGVEHLTRALRASGRKVTAQRLLVYQALRQHPGHPAAEEIHAAVRATLPTISLATVYKVLHELVELGLVRRVDFGDGRSRFDPNTEQHIHARCVSCGRLIDLPPAAAPVALPETAAGFRIFRYDLMLDGQCPACQQASG